MSLGGVKTSKLEHLESAMKIFFVSFGEKISGNDLKRELKEMGYILYRIGEKEISKVKKYCRREIKRDPKKFYAIVFADNMYLMKGYEGLFLGKSDSTPNEPWAANVHFACIKINNPPL